MRDLSFEQWFDERNPKAKRASAVWSGRTYESRSSNIETAWEAWQAAKKEFSVVDTNKPAMWQIRNGVCHAGVRSTQELAIQAAEGMQKCHDLGGSLASFNVRPLYALNQEN